IIAAAEGAERAVTLAVVVQRADLAEQRDAVEGADRNRQPAHGEARNAPGVDRTFIGSAGNAAAEIDVREVHVAELRGQPFVQLPTAIDLPYGAVIIAMRSAGTGIVEARSTHSSSDIETGRFIGYTGKLSLRRGRKRGGKRERPHGEGMGDQTRTLHG